MKVLDLVTLKDYPNYALEFGITTWTENLPENQQQECVRNRYDSGEGNSHKNKILGLKDFDISYLLWEDRTAQSIIRITLNKSILPVFE